jgi:hypothetical protein
MGILQVVSVTLLPLGTKGLLEKLYKQLHTGYSHL